MRPTGFLPWMPRTIRSLWRSSAIRKISWENASVLYRHPVPEAIQRDPEAF